MGRVYHSDETFMFLAGFTPSTICTSTCVYEMSVDNGKWSKSVFGKISCAVELRQSANRLAVRVQSGLDDEIYAVDAQIHQYVRIGIHLGEIHTW